MGAGNMGGGMAQAMAGRMMGMGGGIDRDAMRKKARAKFESMSPEERDKMRQRAVARFGEERVNKARQRFGGGFD